MSKKQIDQKIKNIIVGLKKLNFKSTDNVYIGIDLGKVFINDYEKIFESNHLDLNQIRQYSIDKIIKNLKGFFKDGTIIVPSFNFDYFKERKFNKNFTRSSLGPFENSFIKKKGVSRSIIQFFQFLHLVKIKIKY